MCIPPVRCTSHLNFLSTMGSKKKKQEKKKDFQKTKLRVGKTAARPDNYTDTSFTARSISLPNQSIAKSSNKLDLSHYLLLTRHHSATTRKELLAYIEAHLPSSPSLYKQIFLLTVQLVTDPSSSVRQAFTSLLAACGTKQPGLLDVHMRSVVLYVHSAMSHIQSDVRASSTGVLDVLVRQAPAALVKGHFVKTLRTYFSLMSWTLSDEKKAVSYAVNSAASLDGASKKARCTHLAVLARFLEAALFESSGLKSSALDWSKCECIHPQTARYMLAPNPQAFVPLKLFVTELPSNAHSQAMDGAYSVRDLDTVSSEDQETRRKIVLDVFLAPLRKNLATIVREGGDAGKEAAACVGVLDRFEQEVKSVKT